VRGFWVKNNNVMTEKETKMGYVELALQKSFDGNDKGTKKVFHPSTALALAKSGIVNYTREEFEKTLKNPENVEASQAQGKKEKASEKEGGK